MGAGAGAIGQAGAGLGSIGSGIGKIGAATAPVMTPGKMALKFARGGLQGLGQGLQSMNQQQPQIPQPVNFSQPQQPFVDYTAGMGVGKKPRSPFPGGPNPDAFYGG